MITEAVKKGAVEFLRVALLATLPVIITNLEKGIFDYKVILVAVVIAILKAIDRAVHEYGVLEEEEKSTAKRAYKSEWITGLTRF